MQAEGKALLFYAIVHSCHHLIPCTSLQLYCGGHSVIASDGINPMCLGTRIEGSIRTAALGAFIHRP